MSGLYAGTSTELRIPPLRGTPVGLLAQTHSHTGCDIEAVLRGGLCRLASEPPPTLSAPQSDRREAR